MRLNLGVVEFGDGPTAWHFGLLDVVDGKRRWKVGKKIARTQRNGSTRVLGGLITTKSDAERKRRADAKQRRRDAEDKLLADFAKEQAAEMRRAATEQRRSDKAVAVAEAQVETWGNRPASGPGRGPRVCGQPTEDGTPCEKPIRDARGCGSDHTKAIRQMQARTKTASRGVARKPAGKGKATRKTTKGPK